MLVDVIFHFERSRRTDSDLSERIEDKTTIRTADTRAAVIHATDVDEIVTESAAQAKSSADAGILLDRHWDLRDPFVAWCEDGPERSADDLLAGRRRDGFAAGQHARCDSITSRQKIGLDRKLEREVTVLGDGDTRWCRNRFDRRAARRRQECADPDADRQRSAARGARTDRCARCDERAED